MKEKSLLLLLLGMVILTGPSDGRKDIFNKSRSIKVLSFNIAGDSEDWEKRKSAVQKIIANEDPDIIGFQELLPGNLKWVLDNFKELRWYGRTIEGCIEPYPEDVEGESCRIMYNQERFLLDTANSDSFWFSTTPHKSSEGWEDLRYCVIVRLTDKVTGYGLYFYNTHWSYDSQESRINSARMMVEAIAGRQYANDPFIVTGDFNAIGTDEGIKILKEKMGIVVENGIDWIFAETGKFELLNSEIIEDVNGISPSDHEVLTAEIILKK